MTQSGEQTDGNEMLDATWVTVEALGIPDTPVRRVLFDLAKIIESGTGNEVGLASTAYLALIQELQTVYAQKTPLQAQLEYIRVSKELYESTGFRAPDVPGERFALEPQPETPLELARELGYSDGGKAVRRVLRKQYPHPSGAPWRTLTAEQVNYVRAHLPARSTDS